MSSKRKTSTTPTIRQRIISSDEIGKIQFQKIFLLISFQISFDGYSGHVAFNEYGERVNYTLNVYQVTMNRLPRNVTEKALSKKVFFDF
jgi:hypothetical protein